MVYKNAFHFGRLLFCQSVNNRKDEKLLINVKRLEPAQMTISRDLLNKLEYIHTITESKLNLLAIGQANKSGTKCWGKESDFIWKARIKEDGRVESYSTILLGFGC